MRGEDYMKKKIIIISILVVVVVVLLLIPKDVYKKIFKIIRLKIMLLKN